ncbi:MAG: NADP oxidoreductase [Planctomycetota bacterium]
MNYPMNIDELVPGVRRPRVATVWLDGCSGCHMSLLDMDERLIELASRIDLVCSPYLDTKGIPHDLDVAIVEGAVSSSEDLQKVTELRAHSRILVSLGDCAVTGNIPAMRNPFPLEDVLRRSYADSLPSRYVPALRSRVSPVHEVVPVDIYLPGCPPPADAIYYLLSELAAGRLPDTQYLSRFGR